MLAWWVGASAAAVRHDLVRLEGDEAVEEDYALVSLLRRLRDEPESLGLRLRFSRFFAAAFVPLALAAAWGGRSWWWLAAAWAGGWLLTAAADATGGGRVVRRLGRLRGGAFYAAWARVTGPPARLMRPLSRLRARPGREPAGEQELVLAESRAALAVDGGRLGREERRLLRKLLASSSILVADIMTRWESTVRVEAGAGLEEARAAMNESGHSRLPVVDGARVVGLLTVKDLLRGGGASILDCARPVYFVRRDEMVEDLLDELQRARVHLAVVVDRLGRTVGIVTMEDVLEEIVGELHDERERGTGR